MAAKETTPTPKKISVTPAKAFFVYTLTRDIELGYAILDLLDNCVDGITRACEENPALQQKDNKFEGFSARIDFDSEKFRIEDNCGGIPRKLAETYAFKLGREIPEDLDISSIGMYGIGMKRALFKMGRQIYVKSQHKGWAFELSITPEWLKDQDDWDIFLKEVTPSEGPDGTIIEVSKLYDPIKDCFSDRGSFKTDFLKDVKTTYSFIMSKGFKVFVNGKDMVPKPLGLRWSKATGGKYIAPYLWEANIDEVSVKLAIGFYREMPTEMELQNDELAKRKSEFAGWTVVVNDRVVLYCDKTKSTGWGEGGVPNYHTQFIAISGIVIFNSNKAKKLPLTTTKRGIDQGNTYYMEVKEQMRQSLKFFTDYTNKWKGQEDQEEKFSQEAETIDMVNIDKMFAKPSAWKEVPSKLGKLFKPPLPYPEVKNPFLYIRFRKPPKEIDKVSLFLLGEKEKPSIVGEACFNKILEQADAIK